MRLTLCEFSLFGVDFLFINISTPPPIILSLLIMRGFPPVLCNWEWRAVRQCRPDFFCGIGESVGSSGHLTRGSILDVQLKNSV